MAIEILLSCFSIGVQIFMLKMTMLLCVPHMVAIEILFSCFLIGEKISDPRVSPETQQTLMLKMMKL